jgi:AmmeMemoRadiSam system protein B
MNNNGERIRAPVVAGLFYPGTARGVLAAFASWGLGKKRELGGGALAVIAPHGAWDISGEDTARAFLSCPGRRGVKRVVLLGAAHEETRGGVFLSYSHTFGTPLGAIPVDGAATEALASCSTMFEMNDIPHLRESSLEVLLPFVAYCFPSAPIVPVLMGGCTPSLIKALASALAVTFGAKANETVFIISSCLSRGGRSETVFAQADLFTRLVLERCGRALGERFLDGRVSGCGAPLAAAFLESGLADRRVSRPLSGARQIPVSNGFVCYGSFALE